MRKSNLFFDSSSKHVGYETPQSQFAAEVSVRLCDFWKCCWKRVRPGKEKLNGKVKSLRSQEMEKLRLLVWLWVLMDIGAFHRPQLMACLKIQMWDLPWLHVNSHYFTCEHILVEIFLPFFHYLRCGIYGQNQIYVKLMWLLGFLSWGWWGVEKHLGDVWRCLTVILLYSHPCHCWDLVVSVLFPSGMDTPQMWFLRQLWMIKLFTSFFFPVYTCTVVLIFVLWKHLVPLLIVLISSKVFLTNSLLPELLEKRGGGGKQANSGFLLTCMATAISFQFRIYQFYGCVNQFICCMLSTYY